jgi:hypothetical protein
MDYGKDTKRFCTYHNVSGAVHVTQGMYTPSEAVVLLSELRSTVDALKAKGFLDDPNAAKNRYKCGFLPTSLLDTEPHAPMIDIVAHIGAQIYNHAFTCKICYPENCV